MQHKFTKLKNSVILGIGSTIYTVCTILLILVENKSLLTWIGMILSGFLTLISGYLIVNKDDYIIFDTELQSAPTIIFCIGCILIPVIILITN